MERLSTRYRIYEWVNPAGNALAVGGLLTIGALHFIGLGEKFIPWAIGVVLFMAFMIIFPRFGPKGKTFVVVETLRDFRREASGDFPFSAPGFLLVTICFSALMVLAHVFWWSNHPVRMAQLHCLSYIMIVTWTTDTIKKAVIKPINEDRGEDDDDSELQPVGSS